MGYDLVITSPAGSEQGDAAVRFRGRNRTTFGGNGRVHSNSQQTILEKYAQENGFRNTRVFIDDGWSGTNFAGAAFTEIMEQAEKGLIVTGQAAVQGCDFIRLFCHSSPFHSRI